MKATWRSVSTARGARSPKLPMGVATRNNLPGIARSHSRVEGVGVVLERSIAPATHDRDHVEPDHLSPHAVRQHVVKRRLDDAALLRSRDRMRRIPPDGAGASSDLDEADHPVLLRHHIQLAVATPKITGSNRVALPLEELDRRVLALVSHPAPIQLHLPVHP